MEKAQFSSMSPCTQSSEQDTTDTFYDILESSLNYEMTDFHNLSHILFLQDPLPKITLVLLYNTALSLIQYYPRCIEFPSFILQPLTSNLLYYCSVHKSFAVALGTLRGAKDIINMGFL